VVEQVEHLDDAIEGRVCGEREAALEANVDAMNRIADQHIARHDRAVRTQAAARGTRRAEVTAIAGGEALTGSEEVQPAQLERMRKLPDAVEHGAVTLIRRGQRVLAAEIRRDFERRG